MRRLAVLLPLACLVAAPLAGRAATLPFLGRVDALFGPFAIGVSVEGVGVATLNSDQGGPLTTLRIPAGVFRATALDFPGTLGISQIRVTASNGAGLFQNLTPGGGGGTMPLPGIVRFCLAAPCDVATAILDLPLDPVGAGGTAMAMGFLTVTVSGAPWTKGTTTISTPGAVTVLQGFGHGPLSNTGTTAQIGGVLELVTPVNVTTSLPALEDLTGFAVLRVQFVPEPASGLLVGCGLVLLGLGARRTR